MTALLVTFTGVLGLIFGSFGTVAAWRIPRRENIVTGRSHCPRCGAMIRAFDNVPVLSWLLLRGRCRNCGNPISIRYPLTELATGILFALSAAKFGWSVETFVYAAFFWALVVLTSIDIDHKLLPNRIVYPSFVLGWIGLAAAALVDDDPGRLVDAAVGAAIFGGLLFLVSFVGEIVYKKTAMGLGDVKLAFVLGTFLGYDRLALVPMAMFMSFLSGAVIGLIVIKVAGGDRRTEVPFGPFLVLGTVLALFVGEPLVDAYVGLL
ncbi:MAG TPA: prepilin peptidase [Actinomycetota bacterium]|nr:prepilin peptidase [Actinomycetota bacterium]